MSGEFEHKCQFQQYENFTKKAQEKGFLNSKYVVENYIDVRIPKASLFVYNYKSKNAISFQYLPINRPTIISGTIWKKFPTICNLETSS